MICQIPACRFFPHADFNPCKLIHYLLLMLAVRGEKETFAFVKNEVLKGNVPYERESLIRRIQELAPEEKI